ncbi:hypothetical protein [Persephonella sp.]
MVFLGIQTNTDKTFTATLMDSNRNVVQISHFWKEGLIWYIDHANPDIVAVNTAPWFDSTQLKNAYDVYSILREQFEFEPAEEKQPSYSKTVIKTDIDSFFKQLVRKELLPINTREGIEQRIYNLPKAGIMVKPEMFSKEKHRLQKEVISIATAFSAYCLYHGQYSCEERDGEKFFIPVYRYIPKEDRIVSE